LNDFDLQLVHTVELVTAINVVEVEEAMTLLDDANAILNRAPIDLVHTAHDTREQRFTVSRDDLYAWVIAEKNKTGLALALDSGAVDRFFEEIATAINIQPVDAIFRMEGDRVIEFSGSQNGSELDEKGTYTDVLSYLWGTEEGDVQIATSIIEPDISTASVNELGIREVLGIGISDFSGSPSNRVANILHGAAKLDGLLIPPGEEISLVEKLRPFTIADGYLPELVIKGDEITPEVGGGLCQIGTTTFRAAMNTGLEITERRNHSLVVNYYNDPSNGNPGTDATLYEPRPDFRFRNDTTHHILLDTFVDLSTYELVFTFWGTSDGRKGYYSPPEILSWNGYGATQYIETTDLAPGVTRCQSPHPGATTSFDYIVERPGEDIFSHTYQSTYRSLPRICLVGADPVGPAEVDDGTGELDVEDVTVEG
ncbi:MAG: VanW family protein, partial [bacterium]|nr:VanW family protein [bacterium]